MIPDNPVDQVELTDCLWQVDLPTLSRGQSVDYKSQPETTLSGEQGKP